MLTTTFIGVALAAMLLGAMLFFSAVIAPLAFTGLKPEDAARFVRRLFPWYYLIGIAFSGAAAAVLWVERPVEALIMAGVFAGGVVARQVLMPRINRFRDAQLAGDDAAGNAFDRLHRLSVMINVAQLLALIAVLVMVAL